MKYKIEEEEQLLEKWLLGKRIKKIAVVELKLNNKQHDRKSLTEELAHVRIHFF